MWVKLLWNNINTPLGFTNVMIEGMKKMTVKIQDLKDCCQPSNNVNSELCEDCITAENVYHELIEMGFIPHYNCKVLNSTSDQDCLCASVETTVGKSGYLGGIRNSATVIDSANYLIEIEGIQYNLDSVLTTASQVIPNFQSIITKNENYCNLTAFMDLENIYINNVNSAWIHIWENPVNDDDDVLMIKYNINSPTMPEEPYDAYEPGFYGTQSNFKYKLSQRSFAPWDRFGHIPILPYVHVVRNSFHGDNRGFSLDDGVINLNSSNGVTARLNQSVEFNLKGEKITSERFSSLTKGYKNFIRKIPATHLEPAKYLPEQEAQQTPSGYEKVERNGLNNTRVKIFVQGSDPLVTPLIPDVSWFTPDIECKLYATFYYIEAESVLYINCSLFYKQFPAYEAFIEDSCGNKVFLHTMTAPCESALGGELLNPGWDYHRYFDYKIPVDVDGCFMNTLTELYIDRQTYEVSEVDTYNIENWNLTHLAKPAAEDCPSNPCEGAYPNNGEDLRSEFNCEFWQEKGL